MSNLEKALYLAAKAFVNAMEAGDVIENKKSKPATTNTSNGIPVCHGKAMYLSKFPDKRTGKNYYYCAEYKNENCKERVETE